MALKRLGRACYSRPLCTSHRPSDLGVKGPDVTNLPKSLADPASRPSYPSISIVAAAPPPSYLFFQEAPPRLRALPVWPTQTSPPRGGPP